MNATANRACQQWAEADWGAHSEGTTLEEACDAWGEQFCAETCCYEQAVLSCGHDMWLPEWAASAEEACEQWATSDWGALAGGATLQESCEVWDGCAGTCCSYTAAQVCAVDMWLPDWSWSPTDACQEWATSEWGALAGEATLQESCVPGSLGGELCAGACCTAKGGACVRDIWLPEWAKAAASVFACEDWAVDSDWGALANGATLEESCRDWGSRYCAGTCCRNGFGSAAQAPIPGPLSMPPAPLSPPPSPWARSPARSSPALAGNPLPPPSPLVAFLVQTVTPMPSPPPPLAAALLNEHGHEHQKHPYPLYIASLLAACLTLGKLFSCCVSKYRRKYGQSFVMSTAHARPRPSGPAHGKPPPEGKLAEGKLAEGKQAQEGQRPVSPTTPGTGPTSTGPADSPSPVRPLPSDWPLEATISIKPDSLSLNKFRMAVAEA